MYRRKSLEQLEFEDFYLPFGGKLRSDNRWVKLSKLIPWDEIEVLYSANFSKRMGAPAKPLRMALGALIIKERCGFTDEETVEQIRENPYLQYFIGLSEYTDDYPFDSSMMVHFRKRFSRDMLNGINELIIDNDKKEGDPQVSNLDADNDVCEDAEDNEGKLILDATCAPSDIRYPTDLSLLNDAREKLEIIIDILHDPFKGKEKKPRTYRERARKDYLMTAKRRKKTYKEIRKSKGKQLRYISRDLRYIEDLVSRSSLELLSKRQHKDLLVIHELYRQQKEMYDRRENRIDARIVSISQPHVRPIVRGKASSPTEFGAKISLSLVDGYARLEELSWDNYNESLTLIDHLERYRERYGCYPESLHVDSIYRTRNNRFFCNKKGIRISGPPLGRPRKEEQLNKNLKQEGQDLRDRVAIEGKIGEGKRRYGLSRIMAKLPETSEAVICINILVMNLERKLRLLFAQILLRLFKRYQWVSLAV
ncbi:MAG: IS5 family transposase [Thermodesulfobacteriota bacterium]|nr:IS5 family transposase [Thermodesulfobacteriota bacterium]